MANVAQEAPEEEESVWARYNAAQTDRPLRPLLVELLELAGEGGGRSAIDLGCGLGRETDGLLRAGWRVHAIDMEPGTPANLTATTRAEDRDRLTVQVSTFGDLTELPAVDLVYAGFSVPYMTPAQFANVWSLIRDGLRPGGWCAMNLLGVNDSYTENHAGEWTFFTRDEAAALFADMDLLKFDEEDYDGTSFSGEKHWHLFHVIARNPSPRR